MPSSGPVCGEGDVKKILWFLMFVLTAFVLVSYSACAQVPEEVSYGDHPQQKLDIYVSSPGATTVVMVHGGGFARGDKRRPHGTMLYEHIREVLLANGFNVVAVNYRLAADAISQPPQHPYDFKFPTAHNDVLAAVEWVRDKGGSYGLSWPVGLVGESAGGNLGTYLALHEKVGACGYLDIGGYPDLPTATAPVVLQVAENYIGCPISSCPELWDAASAVRNPGVPIRALLWHGDADTVVDYSQTYAIANKIASLSWAANIPVQVVVTRIIPGAGHTGLPGFSTPQNDAEIVAFFSSSCSLRDPPEGKF